jgi:hypothetical protein
MCTVHDGEPELARLPRLRKSQIKGLLEVPLCGRNSVTVSFPSWVSTRCAEVQRALATCADDSRSYGNAHCVLLGHFAQSSSASRLTAGASKFFILARSLDRPDPIARCSAIRAAISKLQVSQMRTRPSPTARVLIVFATGSAIKRSLGAGP